jgi:hypothetical protein
MAVYLDRGLVAKNDVNGWSFAINNRAVRLNGDACKKLKLSTAVTVTVLFGCQDIPLPPALA